MRPTMESWGARALVSPLALAAALALGASANARPADAAANVELTHPEIDMARCSGTWVSVSFGGDARGVPEWRVGDGPWRAMPHEGRANGRRRATAFATCDALRAGAAGRGDDVRVAVDVRRCRGRRCEPLGAAFVRLVDSSRPPLAGDDFESPGEVEEWDFRALRGRSSIHHDPSAGGSLLIELDGADDEGTRVRAALARHFDSEELAAAVVESAGLALDLETGGGALKLVLQVDEGANADDGAGAGSPSPRKVEVPVPRGLDGRRTYAIEWGDLGLDDTVPPRLLGLFLGVEGTEEATSLRLHAVRPYRSVPGAAPDAHVVRLHAPWQVLTGSAVPSPVTERVVMPLESFRGLAIGTWQALDSSGARRPLRLVFDTGATLTMLDERVVDALGLESRGRSSGRDLAGIVGESERAALRELRHETHVVRGAWVSRVPSPPAMAVAIDGALSPQVLADSLVTFDPSVPELVLEPGALPEPDGETVFPHEGGDGALRAYLPLAGAPTLFMLDTGHHGGILLPKSSVSSLDWKAPPRPASHVMGVHGLAVAPAGRVDGTLGVASKPMEDPVAWLSEWEFGNLGAGILGHFRLTFDRANGRVRLEPLEPGSIPSPPERGVGLATRPVPAHDPPGHEVVGIIPGSPAARAGLEVGDLILEVDGRPAASLGVFEAGELAWSGAPLRVDGREGAIRLEPAVLVP